MMGWVCVGQHLALDVEGLSSGGSGVETAAESRVWAMSSLGSQLGSSLGSSGLGAGVAASRSGGLGGPFVVGAASMGRSNQAVTRRRRRCR